MQAISNCVINQRGCGQRQVAPERGAERGAGYFRQASVTVTRLRGSTPRLFIVAVGLRHRWRKKLYRGQTVPSQGQ